MELSDADAQPRGFGNRTHMHVLMLVPAQHSVHVGVRTFMVAEIDALPKSVYHCVACFTICARAEQQRGIIFTYVSSSERHGSPLVYKPPQTLFFACSFNHDD